MIRKGDKVALNEGATGYPKGLYGKALEVKAVEHYGVFVDEYDKILLASDVRVLWKEGRR